MIPPSPRPTKPIGGFLDEETARGFEAAGWPVVEDAGRGWRRVVASPDPLDFIEEDAIVDAVSAGWVVIAAGGGGIPVIRNRAGELRGVTAVVDKDLASGLLATRLHADLFLISTSIERVALDFGKPNQRFLDDLSVDQANRYLDEGQFAPGSMKPKIEACIRFLNASDDPEAACVITSPENLERAAYGEAGTRIRRRS